MDFMTRYVDEQIRARYARWEMEAFYWIEEYGYEAQELTVVFWGYEDTQGGVVPQEKLSCLIH